MRPGSSRKPSRFKGKRAPTSCTCRAATTAVHRFLSSSTSTDSAPVRCNRWSTATSSRSPNATTSSSLRRTARARRAGTSISRRTGPAERRRDGRRVARPHRGNVLRRHEARVLDRHVERRRDDNCTGVSEQTVRSVRPGHGELVRPGMCCGPARVAIMLFAGTADPVVPFNGGKVNCCGGAQVRRGAGHHGRLGHARSLRIHVPRTRLSVPR